MRMNTAKHKTEHKQNNQETKLREEKTEQQKNIL